MVHALRRIHDLLAPGGCLIDIRPVDERAEFLVCSGGQRWHAGWLAETDEGVEYRQAEEALASAVREALFSIAAERTFTFSHHAPSLPLLQAHLAATWSDAVILPDVAARVEALMAAAPDRAEVVLRETAWMRVLARLPR